MQVYLPFFPIGLYKRCDYAILENDAKTGLSAPRIRSSQDHGVGRRVGMHKQVFFGAGGGKGKFRIPFPHALFARRHAAPVDFAGIMAKAQVLFATFRYYRYGYIEF